jgi:hypothetical protein
MSNFFSGMKARNWKKFAIKLARMSATQGQIGMIFNLVSPKNPSLTRARFTEAVRLLKMGKAPKGFENNYEAEDLACDLAMGRVQIPPEQVKLLQGTSPKPKGKFYLIRGNGSKTNCDIITSTDWEDKENTLVFEKNLSPVCVGQKVRNRDSYIVSGGRAPHKPSSSGRVYVKTVGGDRMGREFFPHVFNMKWIPSYNLYPVDKMSMQPRLKINRKRGLRRNSARSADMTVANELFLFIQNDEILLMRRYPQYVLNLKRKIKRGVYNREKAVKLFMYLADEASKKYSKQFGDGKTHTADVPTRMALAKMLRDKFESEHFERGIGQYMMTGIIDSMKIRKNSTHEQGMVNPDLSTRERDQDSSPLKKLVMDLASDFAPVVKNIESTRYSTTQNNYGRYMSLINSMSKGDKKRAEIIAMALITAGANRSGVKSALRVMFGE